MSDVAIRIENLSKRYRYGAAAPLSSNLRADIGDWVKGMLSRNDEHHPSLHEVHEKHLDADLNYFWALRDINLDIKQGEVVGIIGRNGAGKSTLLKILSRITPPTIGEITYNGRVASLLEVGTGFHRELTGRENVFLNGSILSMKRREITKRFDEIVAFAEVEKFIDTPVKFYSSGMYVRLAFAVAAHLEPEILIIDEVLAVGDAAFQKKCLGKMGEVAKQGRTVLFVSHNMGAIQILTSKSALLSSGRLASFGPTSHVVKQYLSSALENLQLNVAQLPRMDVRLGSRIRIVEVQLSGTVGNGFLFGEDILVRIMVRSLADTEGVRFGITISDMTGTPIFNTFTPSIVLLRLGNSFYEVRIRDSRLAPGTYSISLSVGEGREDTARLEHDIVKDCASFTVADVAESGRAIPHWNAFWGYIVQPPAEVRGLSSRPESQ